MYKNLELVHVEDISKLKHGYANKLYINDIDNQKYIFNSKTNQFETLGGSGGTTPIEEKDPVWEREKGNYTTKAEFQASQQVQDDNLTDNYYNNEQTDNRIIFLAQGIVEKIVPQIEKTISDMQNNIVTLENRTITNRDNIFELTKRVEALEQGKQNER